MITKKHFVDFITKFQEFEDSVGRISLALSGRKYAIDLFECDWYDAVGQMLDTFLKSHFTDDGCDVINYYLFEDCEHVIYEKQDKDLFNTEEKEITYHLDTLDDVWKYITDKQRIKDYVKEINN